MENGLAECRKVKSIYVLRQRPFSFLLSPFSIRAAPFSFLISPFSIWLRHSLILFR